MSSQYSSSRRTFLGTALGACAATLTAHRLLAAPQTAPAGRRLPFPLVDLHVHLDNSSIDQALPLSRERGVKFGIVEHAGTRENKYPVVLGSDDELLAYVRKL